MDYEKAYKEALKKAKQGLPIDEVFPELKEGKDERIRKELIALVRMHVTENDTCLVRGGKTTRKEAVAYLEKQKEQKPAEWNEEDEEHLDSIIESYKELLKDYSANNGVDYIPYNTPVVARTVLNDIKFLKSLRPQPHWKPSEEQMKALHKAAEKDFFGGEGATLRILYSDLQKLL